MGEKTLRWNLLRYNFESQIHDAIDMQKFISHNIYNLLRGSRETREDFRYLQRFFCRTLKLSLEEVRECMDLVGIDELEGFDVIPITRYEYDEHYENNDEDEEENDATEEQEAPSTSEPKRRDPTDEEIMAYMGSLTVEQLVAFCSMSAPPDLEEKHHAEPKATEKKYDEHGFYIEEESSSDAEHEDGAPLARTTSHIKSWADEVEDSVQDAPSPSLPTIESWAAEVEDFIQDGKPLAAAAPSPSLSTIDSIHRPSQRNPKPKPVSNELRALLECIHGDPAVKRTRPSPAQRLWEIEITEAQDAWSAQVDAMKRREGGSLAQESWDEADLLDGWDLANGQYYWQTEGLFLCRLAQVVFKDRFVSARRIYRSLNIPMRQNRKVVRGKKTRRRSSALRNRVSL